MKIVILGLFEEQSGRLLEKAIRDEQIIKGFARLRS